MHAVSRRGVPETSPRRAVINMLDCTCPEKASRQLPHRLSLRPNPPLNVPRTCRGRPLVAGNDAHAGGT